MDVNGFVGQGHRDIPGDSQEHRGSGSGYAPGEGSSLGRGSGGGFASGDCCNSGTGRGWGDSSGTGRGWGEGYCVGSSKF